MKQWKEKHGFKTYCNCSDSPDFVNYWEYVANSKAIHMETPIGVRKL